MKYHSLWAGALLLVLVVSSMAKPVRRGPPPPKPVESNSPEDPNESGLAYDAYLRQVVEVLESDPEFRKKLESANVSDIKSGKIATYLEMVNHTIRTSLDEIKRREIQRLQELARIQMQGMSGPEGIKKFQIPSHLDLKNPHSFEMKDLETLIKKTTADLEELDQKRREDFKEYEMEKKFEEEERLRQLSEDEKKKEMERLQELKKKHAQHPKVNHPGSKDQFEEVWDKVDHLEDQEFNPKTFFFKHDINGDMEWSIDEVDAVLQLELDKVYNDRNSPEEDDPREREEEMNRMREHVFSEMDKDKNMRISFDEFIKYTGTHGENPEFKEDDGWETVDEGQMFTDDEYAQYIAHHNAQPGVVDPPQDLHFRPEHQPPQGQHPDQQQFQQQQFQQQQFQQPNQQQQFQQHPNQQQFQQHPNQQQQQFQQQPNQQQQFQQHPNQQQQFQQPNQQQQQFQQPNQGQQQPNQGQQPVVPQGQPQHPNQQLNANQANMNQQNAVDQEKLQQQLKDIQNQLNQQQQQQQGHQQAQQPGAQGSQH